MCYKGKDKKPLYSLEERKAITSEFWTASCVMLDSGTQISVEVYIIYVSNSHGFLSKLKKFIRVLEKKVFEITVSILSPTF